MENHEEKSRYANRNNWFFWGIATVFAIIVAYKFALSPVIFDPSQISFSEVLTLILALFAMAMSVAFYFKVDDACNQLYDNTYKITKEMAEMLGRIEAGLGERSKHLDK